MKIQYVLWDSDNTLVDTGAHHWRKHFETLKRHGITLPDTDKPRIYTNNGQQNWDWLTKERCLTVPLPDYLDEIDHWYFSHIGEITIRPGVPDALNLFDRAGLLQAVVSNGRKHSVLTALEAKGLTSRFKFIVCKEDYQGRKPQPEPYLAAKTKMQQVTGKPINPKSCLVIEDDPLGVQAGQAAGMTVLHRPPGDDDVAAFLAKCRRHCEE